MNRQANETRSSAMRIVEPITSDLDLDVYDIERRGGTVRITVDSPPGSDGGIDLDKLSLATRLISRQTRPRGTDPRPVHARGHEPRSGAHAAHAGPLPARDRQDVTVRLADTGRRRRHAAHRRQARRGRRAPRPRCCSTPVTSESIHLDRRLDKARTVFEWGPKPKPGKKPRQHQDRRTRARSTVGRRRRTPNGDRSEVTRSNPKEKQPS